ncbi:CHRD domain-containing protein [Flavobacterium sp. LHD-85]|uniref:CHRD domain-containing protein n=1 Tax=Flavobacterium sp. LHD-85 TaxID=3071410 RepID=UPI0027DFBE71|nr:CHRD domain-containing protein [Flavobacterium sp. LHD-85]MDQ6529145.1 CHRD domain-containing protein [Flavobacterium sp. LHD-85]
MKSLLHFSAVLLLLFIGISCSNSDDNNSSTPITVTFSSSLAPPSGVTSSASGSATLKLNQTAKTFEITVSYSGLTPTHGHIHAADGSIVIPFSDASVSTSPFTVTGSITSAQMAELLINHYYVNLHTTAYPNGEISGTLIKTGTSGGDGGGGGGGGY